MKWTPSTIGALVVIVGGVTLRCLGIDAEMWSLTMIAAGFLFGEQYDQRQITKKVKEIEKVKLINGSTKVEVDPNEILQ